MTYYDAIGLMGVTLIVSCYFLIQIGKINAVQPIYSILNMIGSILIIISLYSNFNLPSFIIEAFWILISIVGLIRALKHKAR